MNSKRLTILLSSLLFVSCGITSETATISSQKTVNTASVLGDWSGVLDVGVAKVTFVLHIHQDAEGALSATLDTLEQEVKGTPIDLVSFNGESLTFEIKAAHAKFVGSLTDQSEISGQWIQGGQVFPLSFERGAKAVVAPNRPQEPKLPFPYTVEQVSYNNPEAGITLSGTLTQPNDSKPAAVVLLISGSGPHNRDEALLGHKPFLVLSDYLTRRGIAVLRVDKRGCGESTGDFRAATVPDFAKDALAGVNYLKSRQDLNGIKLGLIGHSEGALVAPIVASQSDEVDFIVLMAGPGVNGEQLLYLQGALIQKAMGESEATIAQSLEFQKEIFTILTQELDTQAIAEQLHNAALKNIANHQEGKITLEVLETQAMMVSNTPWFREFLLHDPTIPLRQVTVPVLALNGELDLQVAASQNLPVIKQALEDAGNKDVTIVELLKLNHLFQTCETGSPAEYAKIEETIAPTVLELIANWIAGRTTQ